SAGWEPADKAASPSADAPASPAAIISPPGSIADGAITAAPATTAAGVADGCRRATRGGTYVCGRYSVNVLPAPGVLDRRISPPSNRANSRLIARPSPVPPYLRLVEPSPRWNASKMIACLSGESP